MRNSWGCFVFTAVIGLALIVGKVMTLQRTKIQYPNKLQAKNKNSNAPYGEGLLIFYFKTGSWLLELFKIKKHLG